VKEKIFIRWLVPEDRSRQVIVLEGREITRFVVQYETLVMEDWLPVVRYDTAHGFAHKDILSPSGEAEKETVGSYTCNEALSNAETDIKLNWQRYKAECLKKMKG